MTGLLNFVGFYAGWFLCVAGAAAGYLWLGPLATVVLLAAHLKFASTSLGEWRLLLTAGALGFLIDTTQASLGLFQFTGTSFLASVCPPWMVALWMLFAATLNHSLSWLKDRYLIGAVLGALSGPLSYVAGARLGAIELGPSLTISLLGIAVAWGLAMPALLALRAHFAAADH